MSWMCWINGWVFGMRCWVGYNWGWWWWGLIYCGDVVGYRNGWLRILWLVVSLGVFVFVDEMESMGLIFWIWLLWYWLWYWLFMIYFFGIMLCFFLLLYCCDMLVVILNMYEKYFIKLIIEIGCVIDEVCIWIRIYIW